jgi:hypothetical protein
LIVSQFVNPITSEQEMKQRYLLNNRDNYVPPSNFNNQTITTNQNTFHIQQQQQQQQQKLRLVLIHFNILIKLFFFIEILLNIQLKQLKN